MKHYYPYIVYGEFTTYSVFIINEPFLVNESTKFKKAVPGDAAESVTKH